MKGLELLLTFACNDCGNDLVAHHLTEGLEIDIEPCETCLRDAHEKEREKLKEEDQ